MQQLSAPDHLATRSYLTPTVSANSYQGCSSPTPGAFPLPATGGCPVARQKHVSTAVLLWSNMIYDQMISKTARRPLVLSRYGGIGNQRYGIGFSGDTESTWPTLRYQVEMTSTAANVLQAYWSHDIGGALGFQSFVCCLPSRLHLRQDTTSTARQIQM